MVEAAPTAAFKVVKAGLLLEFLVVAFDAPAQLGKIDETGKADVGRQARQLVGSFSPFGHSIRSHSSGQGLLRLKSRRAMRMRTRAKRDLRGTFVPSRQVIVRHALAERLKARSLTLTRVWIRSS